MGAGAVMCIYYTCCKSYDYSDVSTYALVMEGGRRVGGRCLP